MGYKIKIKNIPKDVTREYIEHAAPGKGRLIHEAGTRENDREISDMLFRTYGGNITTLKVENVNGRDLRTPDALWDGKYWEYKHVSTKTSIDDRMRAAWHQLRENARRKNMENEPVGLVVDISERRQGIEETLIESDRSGFHE